MFHCAAALLLNHRNPPYLWFACAAMPIASTQNEHFSDC